ncbi:hypothetical protein [Microbacterium sp.]|uniref:hypothetical protein n=1 Tax=Microbacterium sp. TaxID=51671 RepID=UPI0027335180|nr:hypothetical protein [Microbacterium sp.]MDP3953192.1 hypothetical protein [Microbacterium sp.]
MEAEPDKATPVDPAARDEVVEQEVLDLLSRAAASPTVRRARQRRRTAEYPAG